MSIICTNHCHLDGYVEGIGLLYDIEDDEIHHVYEQGY